jgi:signal transduction histidine kinase
MSLIHRHGALSRWDTISLEVRDDGRGCAELVPDGAGAGLRGMSERLAAVGGHLELRPSASGFGLTATVPAGDRVTVSS